MAEKRRFRILALDTNGDSVIKNEHQLLHATVAHGDLWRKPEIRNSPQPHLSDDGCSLNVKLISPDADLDEAFVRAFEIELAGAYEAVESRRLPLLRHYRHQRFDLIYVLRDEVSESIACELYPLLYKVENALRGYLLRFMVTQAFLPTRIFGAQCPPSSKTQRNGNKPFCPNRRNRPDKP